MDRSMNRLGLLIGTGTLVALTLGGCIYSSTEKERVVTAPAPAPASAVPAPPAVVVQQPVTTERVVTHPEGRWQLHGEGTLASPHYWVWVPTGSTPPAPPPLPRR